MAVSPQQSGFSSTSHIDAGRLKGSKFLNQNIVEWWVRDFFNPLERLLIKYRVHPNTITYFGLALTVVASFFLGTGHFIIGGWILIASGCCDFLDGRIARILNLKSDAGAFLDSCLDRYMDAAAFFALLYYFRNSWFEIVVAFAFLGTITTPYFRAKAESLGIKSQGGAMQRPERIVYIGLGGALSGYLSCLLYPFVEPKAEVPPYVLMLSLTIIAYMSNKVSIQRLREGIKNLQSKDLSSKSL